QDGSDAEADPRSDQISDGSSPAAASSGLNREAGSNGISTSDSGPDVSNSSPAEPREASAPPDETNSPSDDSASNDGGAEPPAKSNDAGDAAVIEEIEHATIGGFEGNADSGV